MEKRDLAEDLKNCTWIIKKTQESDSYAQNLYAAFCNVSWQSTELWPTLKEEEWFISWRSAGGLVAELRDKHESYMDWYCSGIFKDPEESQNSVISDFVSEGTVTEEIENDLRQIGWIIHTRYDK